MTNPIRDQVVIIAEEIATLLEELLPSMLESPEEEASEDSE